MKDDIRDIPLAKIEPNPDQPRKHFPDDHIARLLDSIAKRGLLQPITVRPIAKTGRFMIVAGECRWRAHRKNKTPTIRAIVRVMDHREMQLLSVMENLQRRDMNPMEEVRAFKTLLDGGMTAEQIMDELGLRSTALVRQRLDLLELSPTIQKLVEGGNLSVIMVGVAQVPLQYQTRLIQEINSRALRTAEQVKQAAFALRDAAAQIDVFAALPGPSKIELVKFSRLESKIEEIAQLVQLGFQEAECIAAKRVSPDRVKTMAERLTLIRKHLFDMERALRCVATQTELLRESA